MSGRGARDERWRHALLNEAPPGHSPQRLLAALLSPGGVERPERLSGRANEMIDQMETSGGSAVRGAKIYGVVTALAQALSTIAVLGIWK